MITTSSHHITIILKTAELKESVWTIKFYSTCGTEGLHMSRWKIWRMGVGGTTTLDEIPYLHNCLTSFNQIRCITLSWHLYVIIYKWGKLNYNLPYSPNNTILNCILFLHFTVNKTSTNRDIGIKLCSNGASKCTTSGLQVIDIEQ